MKEKIEKLTLETIADNKKMDVKKGVIMSFEEFLEKNLL
jgi:hypothetical protein